MPVEHACIESDGKIVLGFARGDGAKPLDPKKIIL
jgi:hypothetical protein